MYIEAKAKVWCTGINIIVINEMCVDVCSALQSGSLGKSSWSMKYLLKCAGEYKMRHDSWNFILTVFLWSLLWNK